MPFARSHSPLRRQTWHSTSAEDFMLSSGLPLHYGDTLPKVQLRQFQGVLANTPGEVIDIGLSPNGDTSSPSSSDRSCCHSSCIQEEVTHIYLRGDPWPWDQQIVLCASRRSCSTSIWNLSASLTVSCRITQSGLNSTLYFHFKCERILHAVLSVGNPRPKASSSKGIVVRFG